MGCDRGVTCWRRLRDWHAAGVRQRLHETLLAKLHAANLIARGRARVDSATVRTASLGLTASNPPTSIVVLRAAGWSNATAANRATFAIDTPD